MKQFHDILVRHVAGGGEQASTRINPKVRRFKVDKGLITWAGIYYPRGCRGCVYGKIFFQGHQILPRNQEWWTHGENGWWAGGLYMPVDAAPLEIQVVAFQEPPGGGTVCYDHTITAAVEIVPFGQIAAWDKLILYLMKFGKLFGVKL